MAEPIPTEDPLTGHSSADLLSLWHEQSEDFALIFLDLDARVVAANGAVTRVLGYEPAELMGQTLRRIFTEGDLAKGLDVHELEVASQLGRAEDDRWHIGKNERRVWVSGILMPLRDRQGNQIGFAKLLRDRTDMRTEMATLENQLTEARAAATRKDELLSTLGHELRNPLSTLTNACALLRGPGQAERADRIFAAIDRQLAVFGRIVDDLRDVTRVDTGRLRLELEPLNLQAAIRSAIELHRPAAEARAQLLRCVLPEPEIIVLADSVRLEQIIRNLLDNAIKYTPEGGEVAVTATAEGSMAVIRVEDDGIGLSGEELPRIFELFTREDRVVNSAADGLGIGLALVKNLVAQHRGIIQVQSAGPDKGCEFTVQLPLQHPPAVEPPAPS
jgi:PAS domain S-box-containing protein